MAAGTSQAEITPQSPAHRFKYSKVTPEYRKAHKNYVLVAGLLASWELIGIDPTKLGDKWGIQLLSPKGVPLILFTLLVYSAYRVIIEWNQGDDPRPKNRNARTDFWVAHAIAMSAVLIGAIQAILKVRIADKLASYVTEIRNTGVAILFGGVYLAFYDLLSGKKRSKAFKYRVLVACLLLIMGGMVLYISDGLRFAMESTIVIGIIGATALAIVNAIVKSLEKKLMR